MVLILLVAECGRYDHATIYVCVRLGKREFTESAKSPGAQRKDKKNERAKEVRKEGIKLNVENFYT